MRGQGGGRTVGPHSRAHVWLPKWEALCAVISCPLLDLRRLFLLVQDSGRANCSQKQAFCKSDLKLGGSNYFSRNPPWGGKKEPTGVRRRSLYSQDGKVQRISTERRIPTLALGMTQGELSPPPGIRPVKCHHRYCVLCSEVSRQESLAWRLANCTVPCHPGH